MKRPGRIIGCRNILAKDITVETPGKSPISDVHHDEGYRQAYYKHNYLKQEMIGQKAWDNLLIDTRRENNYWNMDQINAVGFASNIFNNSS